MSWLLKFIIKKNVAFYTSLIYGFGLPFSIFKVFLSILYARFCFDMFDDNKKDNQKQNFESRQTALVKRKRTERHTTHKA